MRLLSSTILVNIVRQSCRRFSLATQTQAIRMNQVKMEFDANTSFRRCHGLLAVFRWEVIWIQYFHWPGRCFVFTCCSANASTSTSQAQEKEKKFDPCACFRWNNNYCACAWACAWVATLVKTIAFRNFKIFLGAKNLLYISYSRILLMLSSSVVHGGFSIQSGNSLTILRVGW